MSFETAKYIERNIPNFEVLTEEALEVIEYNAETVLEEIGVNFLDNPDAIARWRDAGADIDGERVRIPRGLARKLCATAPSQYTQHARNPERNVVVGGKSLGDGLGGVWIFFFCVIWQIPVGRFSDAQKTAQSRPDGFHVWMKLAF